MSISREQLIQFIEKPGSLREQTIGALREIVDEFPYFQSAQLLYTCNLLMQDNYRYSGYLKTCSVYATDRTVLYQLLQSQTGVPGTAASAVRAEIAGLEPSAFFELSEEKQITGSELPKLTADDTSETEMIDFDLLSFDQPDVHYQLDDPSASAGQPEPPNPGEKIDLIEQFIKESPTIQPRTINSPGPTEEAEPKLEQENESDEFITETLSRIYLKQGHYQKAIDSFRRLSLKFPEKSVYFAQQIEEIKKLLN